MERARDARGAGVRSDLLAKASEKLRSMQAPALPAASADTPAAAASHQAARRYTQLWGDIAKLAWAAELAKQAAAAAACVLSMGWSAEADPEMALLTVSGWSPPICVLLLLHPLYAQAAHMQLGNLGPQSWL